jgi:IstB-like ATP binding protein
LVRVGGTGTGKSHLAIAIARSCICDGADDRFFNVVDLVNRVDAKGRSGRQGLFASPSADCRRGAQVREEISVIGKHRPGS